MHPDKNQGSAESREKFQEIQKAYAILSDPKKKAIYDETGSYGDDFDEKSFQDAYNYFRSLYKKIEQQDIIDFEKKYRFGPMEEEDLIEFYNR